MTTDQLKIPIPEVQHDELLFDGGEKNNHVTEVHPDIQRFSPEEQKKILRRIDWRILPIVGAVYFISIMDRNNLGSAAIAGMTKDLELSVGMRYSILTLSFFPTYILFELPSTVVIRWITPRWHLSTICLTWGVLLIIMGFLNDWKDMVGLRVILGFLEAGFFPGCMYFLSTWYTRYEMHKRYSLWYFMGSSASAFAGILAYGLMQMDSLQGLAGWRWIFIMEGVITLIIAIIAYAVLVGFPESNKRYYKFLNDEEVKFVLARINADREDAELKEAFSLKRYFAHGLDWKLWAFALIFCMTLIVTYSFAYFLPIILQQRMGFSIAAAQCLIAPPYFTAGLWMFVTGWIGDRYKMRAPILLFHGVLACIGLPLMAFTKNNGSMYFGAFLSTVAVNANIPCIMAYQANNIRGHWKRAFSSALFVGMGGVGGIAGSLVFRSKDAPGYLPGIIACIVSQGIMIAILLVTSLIFMRQNRKADAGQVVIEGLPGFRYTI
ncbi:uncharacterized protein A1O5_08530 [Cladophialophora psammophila CBS 110553]|uniref:Major facilitator superfamily (MFS) profile domain-containing protein n=1 Tax=Cladophialophora psammophila CBS 110553 TaxID=1182543 RepID=W9WVP9_9EURO|nr:uncharacterized protein A1O5_08530 [Cladophialophora psammophila CBS 110553]EXJ68736.1 hypothetical protein A1O5_08530 [Cladophialophora psammophila CBS 110553]